MWVSTVRCLLLLMPVTRPSSVLVETTALRYLCPLYGYSGLPKLTETRLTLFVVRSLLTIGALSSRTVELRLSLTCMNSTPGLFRLKKCLASTVSAVLPSMAALTLKRLPTGAVKLRPCYLCTAEDCIMLLLIILGEDMLTLTILLLDTLSTPLTSLTTTLMEIHVLVPKAILVRCSGRFNRPAIALRSRRLRAKLTSTTCSWPALTSSSAFCPFPLLSGVRLALCNRFLLSTRLIMLDMVMWSSLAWWLSLVCEHRPAGNSRVKTSRWPPWCILVGEVPVAWPLAVAVRLGHDTYLLRSNDDRVRVAVVARSHNYMARETLPGAELARESYQHTLAHLTASAREC